MATQRRSKLPGPVRAGVGLVGAGVEQARKVPERVAALPTNAVMKTLSSLSAARQGYDELAERGEQTVDRLLDLVGLSDGDNKAAEDAAVSAVTDPFDLAEPLAETVADAVPGASLSHDALPLADYDHLTLGQLRSRLRQLDVAQLVQLRDYERTHADRLPIVTLFDNRITKLAAVDPEQTTS
ncbi:MAG: hypothetical protein ABR520_09230 [Mycobacteriales bacterium]